MARFFFAVAFALALQANSTNQAPPTSPEGRCTVSGRVLSAANGQPLMDATVTMDAVRGTGKKQKYSATTDAAGQFAIRNVDPGKYHLVASHGGFVDKTYPEPSGFLVLDPEETSKDVSFWLEPEGVISGHVYDEGGKPLKDLRVQTWLYGYMEWKYGASPARLQRGGAKTDQGGSFIIKDLRPGSYIIQVEDLSGFSGANFSYANTYYPGVARFSDASRVVVRAGGQVAGVDFFLKRVQAFHIRGRVVNAANNASPANIELDLFDSEYFGGLYPHLRVKNSQGYFDIPGVPPGSYFVCAQLKDGDELLGAVQHPVKVVNDDVDGVRLVLTPGPTLAGSVEAKDSIALSSLSIILVGRYLTGMLWKHNESAVKAGGSFEFDGVPDDHYFLRISGLAQNCYVKSANLGGKDILDSGFEISGGLASGPKLNIVLSEDGGRLTGTVMLDSEPLSDTLVTLLPADSSKRSMDWWCKSTRTDGSGHFAFAAIRPGDYRVFAWEKLIAGEGEARDPSFLDHFEDQGQEIRVDSGAALTLQLNAIPVSKTQAVETLLF